ncbi:Chromosome-partitioning protein Spo0J [Posidoniimonas corsicana]|uniref:Chromosome-partitioning protein Spo0J n=1 Tax=Posidoniimonas corsicana TaxID=1938618 RepID=A0A5C5VB60_9BACT|nr:ParB/RepB/Spo0J family partition protein [Posidoniimonas corsicana]TWT35213.1 Chromosome-partitioning protein Spo0J [Posidoniimonas corsicana]
MKVANIPVDLVDEDPNQPRKHFDEEAIEQLGQSQIDDGEQQPIIVFRRESRFRLIDGCRRLRARRLKKQETVLAIVHDEEPDSETLAVTQLVVNSLRKDLTPMEKAVAYKNLKDQYGWSNTEIAKRLHVSKGSVTQALSYLELPEEAQTRLNAGELAESTAYAISRVEDADKRSELLKQAAAGRLKRDDANAVAQAARPKGKSHHRAVLRLKSADVAVTSDEPIDQESLVRIGRELAQAGQRASRDGIDVKTLKRVLRDKHRNVAAAS